MTEIKNTLFRMIKLRSPEQISEEQKTKFFIAHPNHENSSLFAEDATGFQTRVQAFTTMEAESLKSMNTALYDFGVWLLKNRSSIKASDFITQKASINEGLGENKLIDVWDNFIYQCFNFTDFQAKETAMVLIYAEFAFNIIRGDEDEKTFRRLLNAQIVMDTAFWFQVLNETNTNNDDNLSYQSEEDFDEGLEALEAQVYQQELEQVLEGLDKAEITYNRNEQKRVIAYDRTYNAQVEKLYKDATSKLSESQTEADIRVNIPAYTYTPTPAIQETEIRNFVSTQGNTLLSDMKGYDTESFEELKGLVKGELQKQTNKVFKVQKGEERLLSAGGVLMQQTGLNRLDNYAYKICASTVADLLRYNLTVKFPSYHESLLYASAKLYQNQALIAEGSGSNFSQTYQGASMVTLFADGLSVSGTGLRLEITLNTSLENTHTINVDVTVNGCVSGKLQNAELEEPAPDEDGGVRKYGLTRLGIADYQKVEQSICCYAPGEVSHIENVMAREFKERETTFSRSEETTETQSSEVESEKLTDTTSTERFEMNKEISSLMSESKDFSLEAGIQYGGGKLGVSGSVNSSFAYHNSKEESNQQSSNEAKELTERALERIVEKKREERITKIIEEYSESNTHVFDNRQGNSHISGVYRWVDKIYKNEIRNYGKRLIYEFMLPEPARFHLISLQNKPIETKELLKPLDPRSNGLANYEKLSEYTAQYWASKYGVEIEPAPEEYIWAGKAFFKSQANDTGGLGTNKAEVAEIPIPKGYALHSAKNTHNTHFGNGDLPFVSYSVANQTIRRYKDQPIDSGTFMYFGFSDSHTDTVPISVAINLAYISHIQINLKFRRTAEHYKEWQIKTFNQIIAAYETKLQLYENEYQSAKTQEEANRQTNPMFYREIEQMVLRKNCISYMMENARVGQNFQEGTGSLKTHNIIQNPALDTYAAEVKFIEQAFEWEIMSYQFYPFYWANRERWSELYNQTTEDKMFTKFLQSGMARVMLTIRPGFENAVNWFMATGQVWEGGNPPVIGDELYLSIAEELQEPTYTVEGSWESRVPSTLTVIQASSIGLQAEGLPCAEDCTEHQDSGIVQDSSSLTNLTVNIEGTNTTSSN